MNKATTFIIAITLALFCLQLRAGMDNVVVEESAVSMADNFSDKPSKAELEFLQLAKKHKIATRKVSGIREVFNGYYLVAGVFGDQSNAKKLKSRLSGKKLKPQLLYNSQNHMYYVYLGYYRNGVEAVNSYVSDLKKTYKAKVWILHIDNEKPSEIKAPTASEKKRPSDKLPQSFKTAIRQLGIASRSVNKIEGISQGYYLIAGVYGERSNALKHLSRIKKHSPEAEIIFNPNNSMHYVSLRKDRDWKNTVVYLKDANRPAAKLWVLEVLDSGIASTTAVDMPDIDKSESATEIKSFEEVVKEKAIPSRTEQAFGGLKKGFYLVAGVFGSPNNARTYLSRVKESQSEADLVYNAGRKLHYVYLKHFTNGNIAIENHLSGLGGSYPDKLWVLRIAVEDGTLPGLEPQNTSEDELIEEPKEVILSADRALVKTVFAKAPVNDKLLEKADSYFDKMWYAEAAELYEMILAEGPNNQTFDIIRKAGDAHYFNTNMERAFHWYDLLYGKYKSDMKADNLFKYAHSLKGTGKYGRAKRLMKLYNKALKEESASRRYRSRPGESALDNILDTEGAYEIRNIAVNSEYSDFSPMFYQQDKVVYASAKDSAFFNTRRYKWNDQPYLDLYVAKVNEESNEVRSAVKFSKELNTKYHEAAVTFSPDQQTIYFTRNNYGKKLKRDKKGINNLKIYMSRKQGDSWSEAVELPFNSDEYSTGHPALSPDGSKLYFVSDMPGSMGKTDLFVVDVLGDGQYSDPRNLGPEINTERREMFPFISNEKLYFASDGHVGLGGLDIYEATLGEEGFSELRNMGKPINSRRDDFSYIVNEEKHRGFFASNRRGGKGDDDIYSFKHLLPEEPNENAIAGVVTEMVSGDIMPKSLVVLLDENNMKLKEMETDENGSFVFEELESNMRYVIQTEKQNYFMDEQMVSTLDNERIDLEIHMKRLEEMIVLEDGIRKLKTDMIYFDFDKFNIRSDASNELDKLVEVMSTYPGMVIKIESHTDSRGKRAYNKYLSDKRAKSTRDYLISRGIDAARIESAIGYGEERLLNECNGSVRCSSAKHQLNRRSEFIIVKM